MYSRFVHVILDLGILELTVNRTGGVMVSALASSALDREFEPDRVKPKTTKLVCVASPLSTQN